MSRTARFYADSPPGGNSRTPGRVDRDRILYTPAFARLAEVTQVVSADSGYVFHNRLTHSLKVAQIARSITERLSAQCAPPARELELDPDVAEAAALAHDLGHPPFGHVAEEELNECAESHGLADGFEGNAQSFRIVTRLAVSDALGGASEYAPGLNLTRATLNGILKYPWLRNENSRKRGKWGAYESEREQFEWARELDSGRNLARSPEAKIMDVSGYITYAVHDMSDFYCAGRIPLERLRDPPSAERRDFLNTARAAKEIPAERMSDLEDALKILDRFPIQDASSGSREQMYRLWQFSSFLISRYVAAIELVGAGGDADEAVHIPPRVEDEIEILKLLMWVFVILDPNLLDRQKQQREMVRGTFEMLAEGAQRERWDMFVPQFRGEIESASSDALRMRLVMDYVAGFSEKELESKWRGLGGG